MHPLAILAISIGMVFVLIVRLRVNAFIALIAAGLSVGVLSPRVQLAEAMPEVARLFGQIAGNIAIVIALAAVIAQCLLESGAADKISRRIVALLGARHASLALLASGYLLAVPVFFDTVFLRLLF